MPTQANAKRSSQATGLAFNLLALAVMAATGAVGLAYGIDALGRHRDATPLREGKSYVRNLAGHTLTIPATWLRFGDSDEQGFASQVDLQLTVPLGPDARATKVDVTLLPRSRVRTSASLLDGVYLHQFMPNEVSGPSGLVGKPLYPTDGFEGETVWYDPLAANPFVAKCMAPVEGTGNAQCLRTVLLVSGIGAVYTFDADALSNWQNFDAALAEPLKAIGVH